MIKKSLQKAHWVSELNSAKYAGRVTVPWKNPLLAHPCLLRMQAFGLQQLSADNRSHTEVHIISAEMPVESVLLMEDLQSFPYKVFQLRDTSNPFWYQSDRGLNWQVSQAAAVISESNVHMNFSDY